MAMWLRQSTASQEVLLGPFVDSTNGDSEMTALTIANTAIRLWKEGATTEASKNSGGATHLSNGRYYAILDATDTNTLGKLEINIHVAGALATRREYMVLPGPVYDALVLGTDNLDVSTVQLAGQTVTAGAGVTFPSSVASPTNITAGTITTVTTTTNLTNLPSIPSGWLTAAGIAASALNGKGDWNIGKTGYSLTQSFPSNFSSLSISAGGLVDMGAATTAGYVWDAATASYGTAGTYGALIETNLDAAVSSISAGSGPSAATIADAVWDEALSGHATGGSAGAALTGAGSAGDPWSTLLPGAYGAGTAGKIIGDNIDATISSRSTGSAPTAAAIRTEIDTNSTQLAAIKTKTDFLPSVTAGASGGVFIAGSNAATTVNFTGTITTVTNLTNLPAIPANWLTAAGIASGALSGKGDWLNSAGVSAAVWNAATASYGTAGTYGALIETNLDAQVSTAGGSGLTAAGIADAVWDEVISGHLTAGTAGAKLNSASASGDPWSTALPGSYGSGTAGKLVVDTQSNLNTLISYVDAEIASKLASVKITVDANLDVPVSTIGGGSLTAAGIADAVWDELISGHAIVGSTGAKLTSAASAGDPWSTALPGAYASGTAGYIVGNRIDVILSTRLATSSYTAPPDAATIADTVWDETLAAHLTAGSTGAGLSSASSGGDPWSISLPGAYAAGTAGKILGDNLNATITSRASQTSVDTLNGYVDTEILAIKTKTDFLPSATAGSAGGLLIAGTNAATTISITGNITGNLSGSVGSVTGAAGSVTGAVGSVAAGVTLAATTHTGAVIPTVTNLTNLPAITAGWLTASGIAAGALNGKGDWNIGKTGYSLTQAFPSNFASMSITAGGLVDITQTAADKAWGTAARTLTAGTNIVLAKGTGVTGFNDLDASATATAVWNAASSSYGTIGSYGLLLETNLDVPVSTAGGGGGGAADWTADQITAIMAILGIPATGTTPNDPSTGILDTIRDLVLSVKTKTDVIPADPADASDIASSFGGVTTSLASAHTKLDAIQSDADNIQTRIPAALVGGRMDANLGAINNSTTSRDAFHRAVKGNVIGTIGGGSTTTSIVCSALTPSGGVADKFKGRLIVFSDDTTTVNLRGQMTDITANTSAANPTFTVTALTTAPVSGDIFVLV